MNVLKMILKIIILILIVNFIMNNIDNIKNDFKRAWHVQYCNDMYYGNSYKINKCINE